MTQEKTIIGDMELAYQAAKDILANFSEYHIQFKAITKRAKCRFENREWQLGQKDAAERLDLHKNMVQKALSEILAMFGSRDHDAAIWAILEENYSNLIAGRDDRELAETFYNSLTRRIFSFNADQKILFMESDFHLPPFKVCERLLNTFVPTTSTSELIENILLSYWPRESFHDFAHDVRTAAAVLDEYYPSKDDRKSIERLEMVKSVFYRSKGAYLVGRVYSHGKYHPIAFALLNPMEGITETQYCQRKRMSTFFSALPGLISGLTLIVPVTLSGF